ncbi:MAG TPA: 2Fe-2S iron-sulfur cluster-binding protein [Actinomycetota bacterium]|nr:2Fe-2S iron-sulfur cluster-binding protein [Actinomycetota bacterium]
MTGAIRFEGRSIPIVDGDSVGAAMARAGVETFTRSLKYRRRRGLYCGSGDCPNCLVTVDGRPGVRSCVEPARDGQEVRRAAGWPSAEHDLLHVTDRLHRLMPVSFYSKTFIRPRFAWPLAERVIRRATGIGRLPEPGNRRELPVRAVRTDVLVVGGGVAGLAAAAEAASSGATTLLVEEHALGAGVWDPATRERVEALAAEARSAGATIAERAVAVGVYAGPFVPIVGGDEVLHAEAGRVIAATGAVEAHAAFVGNDLPGVLLARGAARLASRGVAPWRRALVVSRTAEGRRAAGVLGAAGVDVRVLEDAKILAAEGARRVEAAVVEVDGERRRIGCDALVLSLGWSPRDDLLRMGTPEEVTGAGDVVRPGRSPEEAEADGRRAARGERANAPEPSPPVLGHAGTVCLCEDVGASDLAQAWDEGFRSAEILKRYTTATMGPCRGAVCGRLLAAFVAERSGGDDATNERSARTTARPPARPVRLADLAAGVDEAVERRTALHDRLVALGGRMERSGAWMRPTTFGDTQEEIRAVRSRAGLLDVGTLARFLVAGRGAAALLDEIFATRIGDLDPGRSRYVLALDEAGYVMDDGIAAANRDGTFTLCTTSGGADRMEAWLRDRIDRRGLHVHLLSRTAELGALLIAGPRARDVLARRTDDDVSAGALPSGAHADIVVAGVPCWAVRVGFVGEVAIELHHPRSRGVALWDALLGAGRDAGIRPFGLDALDVLRLEKGHPYLGQDTLPDDHPAKLGLGWAVATDKPGFVGKAALERMAALPLERRLVGLRIDDEPRRGIPLTLDGAVVGRVTSAARSEAVGATVGLGWLRAVDGAFPAELRAGDATAVVVPTPFYDPEGARLRG